MSAAIGRVVPPCPDDCVYLPGHDAEDCSPGNGRAHGLPAFGPFERSIYEDGRTGLITGAAVFLEAQDDLTPTDLRCIALQAEAAAQWLEAQAPSHIRPTSRTRSSTCM